MKNGCAYCWETIVGEPIDAVPPSGLGEGDEEFCCWPCYHEWVSQRKGESADDHESGIAAAMAYKGGRY